VFQTYKNQSSVEHGFPGQSRYMDLDKRFR
jgi:hypothetical protein